MGIGSCSSMQAGRPNFRFQATAGESPSAMNPSVAMPAAPEPARSTQDGNRTRGLTRGVTYL